MPRPLAAHGTTTRWRTGCRCTGCRAAHAADTGAWRRACADAALPSAVRQRLLRLIRRGATVVEAAEQCEVTQHAVYARRRWDHLWAARLDAALIAGRDPEVPHGTAGGYRWCGCRCPECRAAHHRRVGDTTQHA